MQPHRIVIVGAGFVGLPTARALAARYPGAHQVTLIDERAYFLFSPRLINALENPQATHLTAPLAAIASRERFTFLQGHTLSIDRARRVVFVQEPEEASLTPITYDTLVIAPGAETNFFGVSGTDTFAFPLKSMEHVEAIHHRAKELVRAAAEAPEEAEALLTFAVVGGGPSGIESLFALKRFIEAELEAHAPDLRSLVRGHLIQAAPQILPGFPPRMVEGTMRELEAHGITVHLGDAAAKLADGFLLTSTGVRINTHLIVWCAGIMPRRVEAIPSYATDKSGCLVTDLGLEVEPGVFAAGDCSLYREQNVVIPKNAQTAMLMSNTIVENILRAAQGKPRVPFHYVSRGNLLSFGDTGYIDFKAFQWKTRLAPMVRDHFYRYRYRQLTGL